MRDTVLLAEIPPDVPLDDAVLAVDVYGKLADHYPGHQWRTTADHRAGVVTIQLLYQGVERKEGLWGWVLKISQLDPSLTAVVRAGGELLERFKLPRGAAPEDVVRRALENGLQV